MYRICACSLLCKYKDICKHSRMCLFLSGKINSKLTIVTFADKDQEDEGDFFPHYFIPFLNV